MVVSVRFQCGAVWTGCGEAEHKAALIRSDSSEVLREPSLFIFFYHGFIVSFIDIPLKNKSIGKYSAGSHLYFSAQSTDMWSSRLSIRDTEPDRELDGRQPKEVFSSLQQDVESLCVWVTNLLAALAAARIWYSLERWRKVLNFFMGKDKSPDEKCLRGWCWKDSRFTPCSLEKTNVSFTARANLHLVSLSGRQSTHQGETEPFVFHYDVTSSSWGRPSVLFCYSLAWNRCPFILLCV